MLDIVRTCDCDPSLLVPLFKLLAAVARASVLDTYESMATLCTILRAGSATHTHQQMALIGALDVAKDLCPKADVLNDDTLESLRLISSANKDAYHNLIRWNKGKWALSGDVVDFIRTVDSYGRDHGPVHYLDGGESPYFSAVAPGMNIMGKMFKSLSRQGRRPVEMADERMRGGDISATTPRLLGPVAVNQVRPVEPGTADAAILDALEAGEGGRQEDQQTPRRRASSRIAPQPDTDNAQAQAQAQAEQTQPAEAPTTTTAAAETVHNPVIESTNNQATATATATAAVAVVATAAASAISAVASGAAQARILLNSSAMASNATPVKPVTGGDGDGKAVETGRRSPMRGNGVATAAAPTAAASAAVAATIGVSSFGTKASGEVRNPMATAPVTDISPKASTASVSAPAVSAAAAVASIPPQTPSRTFISHSKTAPTPMPLPVEQGVAPLPEPPVVADTTPTEAKDHAPAAVSSLPPLTDSTDPELLNLRNRIALLEVQLK
jgi:hypothetical protein